MSTVLAWSYSFSPEIVTTFQLLHPTLAVSYNS